MERYMYIGRDFYGGIVIKAVDYSNGIHYGTKWDGAIRYIGYNRRDAVRAFRDQFNLRGVHFQTVECGRMY